MAGPSLEQKLQTIFREPYQIKRVSKEIGNLKQLAKDTSIDLKMNLVSQRALKFNLQLPSSFMKKMKERVDLCITIDVDYPTTPPKLHFTSANLPVLNLLPFREYFSALVPAWSAKITLVDLVNMVPGFIADQKRIKGIQTLKSPEVPFSEREFFDQDRVFSWKFVQSFPVRLIRNGKQIGGLVVVSPLQIVLLEGSSFTSYYITADLIPMKQVVSIMKSKNHPNKILIEIRRKSRSYGIELVSDQYDSLMSSIADSVRKTIKSNTQLDSLQIDDESQSQSQEEEVDFFVQQKDEINIQQIKQGICVYESLVDIQMTSENVSCLLELLQKYYSAKGDSIFKFYLTKMQDLMSNQMTQVLINSKNEDKMGQKSKNYGYMSIIDMY